MDALDLDLHLLAQLLVECPERLVHQQQARMRHQRPRHGDPLLLAAGQLSRVAVAEMAELHQGEHLVDPTAGLLARKARAHAQGKAHIVGDRHVRKQRVGLEHHADIALVRRHIGNRALVQQDVAGIGGKKSGDQIEGGGLARSAGAEQGHEGAGRNVERDLIDRFGRPEGFRELTQSELGSACLCRGDEFGHAQGRSRSDSAAPRPGANDDPAAGRKNQLSRRA